MAINGADVVLYVEIDGTMTSVGSQSNVNFDETTDVIDVSSKDSRAREILPGRYSASVSLDGFFIPSSSHYEALRDAMRNGTEIAIRRYYSGTAVEEADAIVSSLSSAFPDQGGATVAISLEVNGSWSAVV